MNSWVSGRKLDLVVERQWHIGMHARALLQNGSLGRVIGGFPSTRYLAQGIPKTSLRTKPLPAIWNHLATKIAPSAGLTIDEPQALAAFARRNLTPGSVVGCYATTYRHLFPMLASSDHPLLLERGSTHPEFYFQQLETAREEAGLRRIGKLPTGVLAEIEAAKMAHFIGSGSQMITDSYTARGFSRERILEVPWCADEKFFSFVDRSTLPLSRPLRLLCVGVVGLRKGLGRLAKIARWLEKSNLHAEIRVIGPLEPEAPEILSTAPRNLNAVGVRKGEALRQEFHEADLYILPSYEEGFGISILEAMSTGLPAIVSEETGGREAISSGRNGMILTGYEADQLDSTLAPLLQDKDLRLSMGKLARERVMTHYTEQHYSAGIAREYQRMFEIIQSPSTLSPAWQG